MIYSYDKNHESIQKVIDSSPKAEQYYSDGNTYYFNFNYHQIKYKFLKDKI